MKTKEELNEIKEEYEDLKDKLFELTEDEMAFVTGGVGRNHIPGWDESWITDKNKK